MINEYQNETILLHLSVYCSYFNGILVVHQVQQSLIEQPLGATVRSCIPRPRLLNTCEWLFLMPFETIEIDCIVFDARVYERNCKQGIDEISVHSSPIT